MSTEKKLKIALKYLLSNPKVFNELCRKAESKDNNEIIDIIKSSDMKEQFIDLTNEEIYQVFTDFLKEIEELGKYLINSEIRSKTFYYLGKQNGTTASEIAKKMAKDAKNISIYLEEFDKVKKWAFHKPEGRRKIYMLTELGKVYYDYFQSEGFWFPDYEDLPINEFILKIDWLMVDSPYKRLAPIPYKEHFPKIDPVIKTIRSQAQRFSKELGINIPIPIISKIGHKNNLLSIETGDESDLALIIAVFNYMEKNFLKKYRYPTDYKGPIYIDETTTVPHISQIKIISVESYLDLKDPAFLSEDDTKNYIEQILIKFKNKIKTPEGIKNDNP